MYAYIELKSKFDRSTNPNKREYKLENNTYVQQHIFTDYSILLHGSIIAIIKQDKIILDSCGYRTMTTKDRLNKILDDNQVNYRIYQDHFTWYLWDYHDNDFNKHKVKFYNGITFIYETSPLMGIGWRISTE